MTRRAEWFAEHILPLEPQVRGWLRKAGWAREEIEDLIQESYARLAGAAVAEIGHPGAYLFRTVRNAAADHLRRKRIVSIHFIADISRLELSDDAPDPEARISAHQELEQLRAAIERLPGQCRAVFVLRKVEGLSQAQTAERLGLSQSTVEKHVARGMRLCAAWLTKPPTNDGGKLWKKGDERPFRNRRSN